MKKILLPMLVATTLLASGCTTMITPVANTVSDLNKVDFNANYKVGKDCVSRFFIFGPFGNASVPAAAKKAGITQIAYVDTSISTGFLSLNHCVNVYGK